MSPVRQIWASFKIRHNGNTPRMRCVNAVNAWVACGARKRCLVLLYRGMRRNTSSCTSREIEALVYWISLKPRACHICEELPGQNPLYFAQAPIFCLHSILFLILRATRAPYRSRAGPPSDCGIAVGADVTHDEYERHRACPSVKRSTKQPCHVPLHARTLRGAALSS